MSGDASISLSLIHADSDRNEANEIVKQEMGSMGSTGSLANKISSQPDRTMNATMLTSSEAAEPSNSTTANMTMTNMAATTQVQRQLRQSAWRQVTNEDQRRMKFLALLAGKGCFHRVSTNTINNTNNTNNSSINNTNNNTIDTNDNNDTSRFSRERTFSLGGMGSSTVVPSTSTYPPANQMTTSHFTNTHNLSTIVNTHLPSNHQHNYQPTTPQNLSRRILHRQGVGYFDDNVSLLLSAASDRFLATVLAQAIACRDRRLEGYQALFLEQKLRKRHFKRVTRERMRDRDKRFQREMEQRRHEAQTAIRDCEGLTVSKAGPVPGWNLTGKDPPLYGLSEKEKEAKKDYIKAHADLDAEEHYYHSYWQQEEQEFDIAKEKQYLESEEEDSDDELMPDNHYDLALRDLVHPLSAWGFDLSAKFGFHTKDSKIEEEESDFVVVEEENPNKRDDGDLDGEADDEDGANNDDWNESNDEENNHDDANNEGDISEKLSSPEKKVSPVKPKKKPARITATKRVTAKRKIESSAKNEKKVAPAAKKAAVSKLTMADTSSNTSVQSSNVSLDATPAKNPT